MRASKLLLGMTVLALLAGQAALATDAKDRRMAVRFGAARPYVEPATYDATTTELDGQNGAEVSFEWYATRLVGIELQSQALRYDVLSDGNNIGEAKVNGLNLNLNIHIVRSRRIDFALGGVLGFMNWDDIEFTDGSPDLAVRTSGTIGAQATIDFNIGSSWAIYIGWRYQVSDLILDEDPSNGVPFTIPVDPLIGRVGATFRFGGR